MYSSNMFMPSCTYKCVFAAISWPGLSHERTENGDVQVITVLNRAPVSTHAPHCPLKGPAGPGDITPPTPHLFPTPLDMKIEIDLQEASLWDSFSCLKEERGSCFNMSKMPFNVDEIRRMGRGWLTSFWVSNEARETKSSRALSIKSQPYNLQTCCIFVQMSF